MNSVIRLLLSTKQLFAKMCEITSLVTSVKTVSNFIIVVFRKIPSKDSIKIRDLMCNEIGRIEEKNYVFFKEIADNRQWVFVSKSQTEEVI